jgi:hypothetical protein
MYYTTEQKTSPVAEVPGLSVKTLLLLLFFAVIGALALLVENCPIAALLTLCVGIVISIFDIFRTAY